MYSLYVGTTHRAINASMRVALQLLALAALAAGAAANNKRATYRNNAASPYLPAGVAGK